jgi:RNA exonuclease 4
MYAWCYRLTKEVIEGQGLPLEQALQILRHYMPRNSILVGQNIRKDVDWLQLKEGQDFQVGQLGLRTCFAL